MLIYADHRSLNGDRFQVRALPLMKYTERETEKEKERDREGGGGEEGEVHTVAQ